MVLLLREQTPGTELWELQQAFCPSHECLVKGIVFFGTPFKGSILANYLADIAKYLRLPINKTHVMSL